MSINLPLPKWLTRKLIRPGPRPASNANLKQRQILPTLPANRRTRVRFQDDDSPPGYRIHWRQ